MSRDTANDSNQTVRGPRFWVTLEPWARVSLIGLGVSVILALVLGWYIPYKVEQQFLQSMADANEDLTMILVSATTDGGEHEIDMANLDGHVTALIERDRLIRTKLWSVEGTIVYSDEDLLIGQQFETHHDFGHMVSAEWHISDLTAEENMYERGLGADRLLETYVPVFEGGEIRYIWEVYESLDDFDNTISGVRTTVWTSIGIGLVTLAGFLAAAFGALIRTAEKRRAEAERRSKELQSLLELARISGQTLDSAGLAEEAIQFLIDDDDISCVCLVHSGDGDPRVLAQAGDLDNCGIQRLGSEGTHVARPSESSQGISHVQRENYGLWVCHAPGPVHRTETALQAMLEEIANGVDKALLYEELEANRAHIELIMERLLIAQEEERRSTVAEIHDGLAQDLYRVLFGIRGCLSANEEDARTELVRLEELVADSSRQLRRLLQEIHPSVVDDVGLAASLQSLVERVEAQNELDVDLDIGPFSEPEYDKRMAIFRIAQEALVNAAKHSGASQVSVVLSQRNGSIVLSVTDAGHGIRDDSGEGIGMWIMKERAEAQGGSIDVSSDDAGTTIEVSIPNEVDYATN